MKIGCALAGVGAGLVLAAASFGVLTSVGVWREFAAVLALLCGVFAAVTVAGTLRYRNAEINELSAADREMWTPRNLERDLSPHSAWTHEPQSPARKRGRR